MQQQKHMSTTHTTAVDSEPSRLKPNAEANRLMGAGLGLGAWATLSTLVLGSTCPLCVVAAPAMLGLGVYKRLTATEDDT